MTSKLWEVDSTPSPNKDGVGLDGTFNVWDGKWILRRVLTLEEIAETAPPRANLNYSVGEVTNSVRTIVENAMPQKWNADPTHPNM
jgi:hypothetical protein